MSVDGYAGPSFFIPARNKKNIFVMGVNESLYEVLWDGFSTKGTVLSTIVTVPEEAGHHTNAGIAGPKGAFYFGYFNPKLCGKHSFYLNSEWMESFLF